MFPSRDLQNGDCGRPGIITKTAQCTSPEVVEMYPSEDLAALLGCIDNHTGRGPREGEKFQLQHPVVTPYVPERRPLKAGSYMGTIIIEDAGDLRVNGKYTTVWPLGGIPPMPPSPC